MDTDFKRKKGVPRGVIWALILLAIFFFAAAALFTYQQSNNVKNSVSENLDTFQAGVSDLKNMQLEAAAEKFSEAGKGLDFSLSGFVSKFQLLFSGAGSLISGFQGLTAQSAILAKEVSFLENNALNFFLDSRGGELISHLETLQKSLEEISVQSDKLSAGVSELNLSPSASDFYIPFKLDIARYKDFVDSLLAWLRADTPRHLLLMLQNTSEMRPAGGFLGSYIDLTISGGNLASVEVHDINDADRQLDLKTIPPKPLQALVTNWRAADANWFFDFPASAAQVVKFMEASNLYSASSTTFDGAMAVSPKVIEDILSVTGPVKLEKSGLILNESNFLDALQAKVQAGQATQATYPKSALGEFYAAVSGKLKTLNDADRQALFSLAKNWLTEKDIMIYFSPEGGSASGGKDTNPEKFFDYYGMSGKVYDLTQDFEGDYLAIVDANIGGGKSDRFMKQNILLESQINENGIVSDHLVIDRSHEGNKSQYWWYKTANQDYLQIFVPLGSQLTNFKGGIEKTISAPINYAKSGYVADDFITQIESSTEKLFNYPAILNYNEFGKEIFATWSKVAAGKKTEITFDYTHRLPLAPSDGQKYQFVFEKQAGSERSYKFLISAPVGYRFQENNLPVFEYNTNDSPGRLVLDLTLKKI